MVTVMMSIAYSAGVLWIIAGTLLAMIVLLSAAAGILVALCYVVARRNIRVKHAVLAGASVGATLPILLPLCYYAVYWLTWNPFPNALPLVCYVAILIPTTVLVCRKVARIMASRVARHPVQNQL